ncbi:hypothetical protein [Sphingomonas sp. PAMC 26605]|uniref:hypothetical protein n=1 Tax=Sphingomonas sp. PAMC 26605 TaxID=1112214 RepID=UPI00026CCB8E|nr:hypothetical protein [Sphingomonas sp. PAMC 26605]
MNDASSHTRTDQSKKSGAHSKTNTTQSLRDSAGKAIETTGESLRDIAGRAANGIEANPISALVGGIALGAVAGAFVPRTDQEAKLLAPVGQRLSDTARGAVDAAKDTAKSELGVLGLSRDSARSQMSRVLEGVIKAVSTAGLAALTAANDKASSAQTAPNKAGDQTSASPTAPKTTPTGD